MLSTQSLREQMDRYAESAITADGLEEWLASESWDMTRWAPPGLQRLVESIQSAFINYSSGNLSAEALADFLQDKRAQLHRAAEASRAVKLPQPEGDKAVAASSSITIDLPAVAVA